jgi:endoglucanase
MFRSIGILIISAGIFLFNNTCRAQSPPFSRGVNLTSWFQASNVRQIQFTKYTRQDFEQIKSLGCDAIRVPINLHFMTQGAPSYTIDPLFYTLLDQVVDWAEELEIHLILDNHTFDPAENTDPAVGNILEKVWAQMAEHYKNRSEYLYYEILNEPHGITGQQWNAIQQDVVDVIRGIDPMHTIVIGPANWNSYHNLDEMPVYTDKNLIYTFHFYDPFLFTHQGAGWTDPSMAPLAGVPFPYAADQMPSFPPALDGTWIESSFNNYQNEGTVARVQQLIDLAVQFSDSRSVPLFCGEFGVYIPNSDPEDRVFWYETTRRYLEEKEIAWTTWDYHGGFGLFEEGGNGLFDHDLNVPLLEALGLNVPDQSEFVMQPDSTGFMIYGDYIEKNIFESGSSEGKIDFYSTDKPNNGQYCISWTGASQYNQIGFDFRPNKDLSYLVEQGYALDLFIRGNGTGTKIDIRFIDTKTIDPDDHPWRMGITIDETRVDWDSRWHHLHIPLNQLVEKGSWDNGWFIPEGKYDWKAVDRFEIVAEHHDLEGIKLWFDNLLITDQDTAQIHETGVFEEPTAILEPSHENELVKIYPNPVQSSFFLESTTREDLYFEMFNMIGIKVMNGKVNQGDPVKVDQLPEGLYVLRLTSHFQPVISIRIVKE